MLTLKIKLKIITHFFIDILVNLFLFIFVYKVVFMDIRPLTLGI